MKDCHRISKNSVFAKVGLIGLLLIANGCLNNKLINVSEQNRLDVVEKLHRTRMGKDAAIVTDAGDSLTIKNIAISRDSIFWQVRGGSVVGSPLARIKTISFSKRNAGKGFLNGLLIGSGFGAGIAAVLVMSYPSGDFDCNGADSFCITKGQVISTGAMVLGIPFSLIGLIHGAATETTETYRFTTGEE
ncbi:MAG: hypothetical protein ACE5G1_02300 [bacterium]